MKNAIDNKFVNLKKQKKKALIAYLTAGYPPISTQASSIKKLESAGVDCIEIGIPFSDPIADGPTIQFSSQKSLERGINLPQILRWTKQLSKKVSIPIVLMGYVNPFLKFGLKKFAKQARQAGVSGIIIPDLIVEESAEVRQILLKENIHLIYLVTPTTPIKRQLQIARLSGGFLYAVSVTGVTGARKNHSKDTQRWLTALTKKSPKPVCVGFGISGRDHVRKLRKSVDGFIVGSAFIDIIRKNKNSTREKKMASFARELSKECFYGR